MCMVAESCPVAVSENLFQWGEGPLNGGGNHDPLKVTTKVIVALIKFGYMLERPCISHYLTNKVYLYLNSLVIM
jgi:hypothetical protein